MKRSLALGLITSTCLVLSPLSINAHTGATGVVKERMDGFKAAKKSMRTLKSAIRSEDFTTIEREASSLALWFSDLDSRFPAGSNPSPSEALDIIWEEFDQFSSIANDTRNSARMLAQAAINSDTETAKSSYFDLAASCKACHNDYRE